METVGMVDVTGFEPDIGALLWSCQNGQRKGEGLADVLFGIVNPSGHLPFTWYRDDTQIPPIDDYAIQPGEDNPGRTYMYFQGETSYPFGYGLSYTDFAISGMKVNSSSVAANDRIFVTASVTNTGAVAGAEVIQLYAGTPEASESLNRPKKRLMGFKKVYLDPGESKKVCFNIDMASMAFFDEAVGRKGVDPDLCRLELSTSADDGDVKGRADVQVTGGLQPKLSVVTAKPVVSGDEKAGITRRVFFPKNATVDPRLTVSLSDDNLYGYITLGKSVPLPEELKVFYSSNRREIVNVDLDGTIHTGSESGVATVTVRVKYGKSKASTSFVVYVQD
jgi:beta-glucosidase